MIYPTLVVKTFESNLLEINKSHDLPGGRY
jgi:hypothetical protein